jgi:hypothetical protein
MTDHCAELAGDGSGVLMGLSKGVIILISVYQL